MTTKTNNVSIHAPAWGATSTGWSWRPGSKSFNPRTRVGCDKCAPAIPRPCGVFQSTHPRGVRL